MLRYLLLHLLLFCHYLAAQNIKATGLEFNSGDSPLNLRSSLTLTQEKKLLLKDNFTISFEICFREAKYYGPIVSVVSKEFESELLFIPNPKSDTARISFIQKKSSNRIDISVSQKEITSFKYINSSLYFDLVKKEVSVTWNNSTYKTKLGNSNSTVEADIFFGRIRNFGADTPKINLREIKLYQKHELQHYWKLDEVKGQIAHDAINNQNAYAENPNWILKSRYHWKKITEIGPFPKQQNISHSEVNFVFNNKTNQINLIYKDFLYKYNALNNELIKETFNNQRPHLYSNEIYDSFRNILVSHYNGQGVVSSYDSVEKKWTNVDTTGERQLHFYGHNLFINPLTGDLMMMNGYGWHLTKNTLQKYDYETQKWTKISLIGDFIPPRRDASIALIGNSGKLILFGGGGNESGKQEDGYRFLRDIFIIDLKSNTAKKLGEGNSLNPNIMPLMSSYYDHNYNQLYVVMSDVIKATKPKRLYKISLDNMKWNIVSDSVLGGDINWKNGIVFSETTNKFYTVTNGRKEKDLQYFDLYELNYPPITNAEFLALSYSETSGFNLYVLVIGLILLTASAIITVNIVRKKKKVDTNSEANFLQNKLVTNSIFLFGDFQIIDKNGLDITKEFSPKLKQLFLLLLLKSYNGVSRGIGVEALSTYLWPDADNEQTKNNRNVSISKLRAILSRLDNIEIKNERNTLELVIGDSVYCDYLSLRKAVSSEETLTHISLIKAILSRGYLLSELSYEWLDGIKLHFIEEVTSKLKMLLSKNNLDRPAKLDVADSILFLDSVNEEGLSLKIKMLIDQGDHQLAKNAFEHFKNEYKRLYAEEYKKSFKDYYNNFSN